MGSKEVYHRITYTADTGIGNGTNAEVALTLPQARGNNALWELVSFTYKYVSGTASNVAFSVGEATGLAPGAGASVYEGAALAKSTAFHKLDLARGSGPIIVSPDAASKIYLHATFAGASTNNKFVVRLAFKQLKGRNRDVTV